MTRRTFIDFEIFYVTLSNIQGDSLSDRSIDIYENQVHKIISQYYSEEYPHTSTGVLSVEVIHQENLDDMNHNRFLRKKMPYEMRKKPYFQFLRSRNLQDFSRLLISTNVTVETKIKFDDMLPVVGAQALSSKTFLAALRGNEFIFRFAAIDVNDFDVMKKNDLVGAAGESKNNKSKVEKIPTNIIIPVASIASAVIAVIFTLYIVKKTKNNAGNTSQDRRKRNNESSSKNRSTSLERKSVEKQHRSRTRNKANDFESNGKRPKRKSRSKHDESQILKSRRRNNENEGRRESSKALSTQGKQKRKTRSKQNRRLKAEDSEKKKRFHSELRMNDDKLDALLSDIDDLL